MVIVCKHLFVFIRHLSRAYAYANSVHELIVKKVHIDKAVKSGEPSNLSNDKICSDRVHLICL